jgi:hypothetical protein
VQARSSSCMLVPECGRSRYPLSGYWRWPLASRRCRQSRTEHPLPACTSTQARRRGSSTRFRFRRPDKRHRVPAVRAQTATRRCSGWGSNRRPQVPAARPPQRQGTLHTAPHPHGPGYATLTGDPHERLFRPSDRRRAEGGAVRPTRRLPGRTRRAAWEATAGFRWWQAARWFWFSAEAAGWGCGAATSGRNVGWSAMRDHIQRASRRPYSARIFTPPRSIGSDQWQPAII